MSNISKLDVLFFLKDHYLMQIATVFEDQPGVYVMLYTMDDEMNFYFGTHKDSFKIKSILSNKKVSLVVWEFGKMRVQVNGIASTVDSLKEQGEILDKLADSATKDKDFWPPLFRIKGGEYILMKIKPTWMRVLDLKNNTIRQEENPFVEIKL